MRAMNTDVAIRTHKRSRRVSGFNIQTNSTSSETPAAVGDVSTLDYKPTRARPSRALRDELQFEARVLEEQLEALRVRAGLPSKKDKAGIENVRRHSKNVERQLYLADQYLGRLNAMVTNELLVPPVNPMTTYIHLPRDLDARRATMRAMQDHKLRRAVDVILNKFYHHDPMIPYSNVEGITTENGEYHCLVSMVNQFPNFQKARQLFDAFVELLSNLEISVTDNLGQFTLREDANEFDPTMWNHRIVVVSDDVGCTEELNNVGFARFFEHSPNTDSPMGIITLDTANVDDLYPYVPEERTSKDSQAAMLVYEAKKPNSNETIVVLKQFYVIVQLPPQFELAPSALRQLQANCPRWCYHVVKHLSNLVVVPDPNN